MLKEVVNKQTCVQNQSVLFAPFNCFVHLSCNLEQSILNSCKIHSGQEYTQKYYFFFKFEIQKATSSLDMINQNNYK